MISDLSVLIKEFEDDRKKLEQENTEVQNVLEDEDLDTELRESLKKEIHEGQRYMRSIDQWVAYLKVKRKNRCASLYKRKDQESLIGEAKAEVRAYKTQKRLKPIKTPWRNRYRTAIEL